MGRTTKPLWLIVHDTLLDYFTGLEAQGHRIQALSAATGDDCMVCDAIVGPTAWRIVEETTKYIDTMVRGVRQQVYGPTKPKPE